MPKCSIIECGSIKNKDHTSLTLHRLPRGELKKKKWLEAIGTENIWLNSKHVFICSLHFHQNSVNRTLDVLRLQDDAVPILHLQPNASQGSSVILTENSPHATTSVVKDDARDLLAIETAITKFVPQPFHGTSRVPAETVQAEMVKKIEATCVGLRKKVKRLYEQT